MTKAVLRMVFSAVFAATGCTHSPPSRAPEGPAAGWVYQLQGYPEGRLDELARAPQPIVVIDLARDAQADYFQANEISEVRASGKKVLAYFEIGSIEDFRPEYPQVIATDPQLVLNRWPDWPNEYFVRYWEPRWWEGIVRARVDQALRAGFDGVYLDTPLAYEEVDLSLTPGQSRETLGRAMVDLIIRVSRYAKSRDGDFLVVPQNSPELRLYSGYVEAVDGIGMEELFVRATDEPCTEDYCSENLANTRALRDAGKFVLAVDYATRAELIRTTCARYRVERFAGFVADRALDRSGTKCM